MFFLLRCAFWLGLAFSAMDGPSEGISAAAAGDIAAKAAARASRVCLEHPRACVEAAKSAQGFGLKAEIRAPRGKPAKNDTLEAADKAPPWRGRG